MNIALWILQSLLSFAMIAAGGLKLLTPRDKLLPKMPWTHDFTQNQIKLIGAAELLGGLGLVLPWATGILPILTSLAALGLTLIMAGAVATHLRRKEPPAPAVVLFAMALFIALGRLGIFG